MRRRGAPEHWRSSASCTNSSAISRARETHPCTSGPVPEEIAPCSKFSVAITQFFGKGDHALGGLPHLVSSVAGRDKSDLTRAHLQFEFTPLALRFGQILQFE